MIVNREYPEMTPVGMKFSTLAGTVGGGQQTPGFIGHSKHYIFSRKFIAAEGRIKRIVWMPTMLKEEIKNAFIKRAEELELGGEQFLAMAMSCGLDSAIADVFDTDLVNVVATTEMLMNKQIYSDSFLKVYTAAKR